MPPTWLRALRGADGLTRGKPAWAIALMKVPSLS